MFDPDYAWAYYILGRSHMAGVWLGTTKSPKDSIGKSIELAQKSIVMDDTYTDAHGLLGFLFSMTRQYDKAIAEAEKAVALNPNSADSHFYPGKVLTFDGRWAESILEYKIAIRLNPIPSSIYFWSLGLSYGVTGQYDEAIPWCEKAVHMEPDSLITRMMMTAVYSWSGKDEEARAEAAEVLRIDPDFSLEKFAKKAGAMLVSALRKAGLK